MGRPLHYSPAIRRHVVTALYHERRRREVPMTRLVDELLTTALKGSEGWRLMEEHTQSKPPDERKAP